MTAQRLVVVIPVLRNPQRRDLLCAMGEHWAKVRVVTASSAVGTMELPSNVQLCETVSRKGEVAFDSGGFAQRVPAVSVALLGCVKRADPSDLLLVGMRHLMSVCVGLVYALRSRRVYVLHDGVAPDQNVPSLARILAARRIGPTLTGVIANSREAATYVQTVYGMPSTKVEVVEHLVPGRSFAQRPRRSSRREAPPNDTLRLLYVGKLLQRKGVDLLLRALAEVCKVGTSLCTLRIVGTGPEQAQLTRLTSHLGIGSLVEFSGWIPYEELPRIYDHADLLVVPSRSDAWATVVPEALSRGVPVVCSARAGAAQLIRQHENGLVFDPDSPNRLSDALRWIVNHPARLAALGQGACRSGESVDTCTEAAGKVTAAMRKLGRRAAGRSA